ncbi:hypothetical protein ACHQM5_025771 [Ranunculus cassubicifolius]
MCPSGGRLPASRETTSEFRSAFDILDTDHDGKISRDDLRTFYTNTKPATTTTSDEDIGTMISVADFDKDGFVEFDEFKRVLNRPGRGGGLMEDVFRMMDRDGDGMVGFDDLKSYMEFAGFDSTTDQDIKTMIKLGGGDDNAGVSFQGFLKILAVDSTIGL